MHAQRIGGLLHGERAHPRLAAHEEIVLDLGQIHAEPMERLAPLVDVRQRCIRLGALLVQPLPRLVVHAPALLHAVVGSVEHQRFRQLAGNLHREGRAIAPDGDVGG